MTILLGCSLMLNALLIGAIAYFITYRHRFEDWDEEEQDALIEKLEDMKTAH